MEPHRDTHREKVGGPHCGLQQLPCLNYFGIIHSNFYVLLALSHEFLSPSFLKLLTRRSEYFIQMEEVWAALKKPTNSGLASSTAIPIRMKNK